MKIEIDVLTQYRIQVGKTYVCSRFDENSGKYYFEISRTNSRGGDEFLFRSDPIYDSQVPAERYGRGIVRIIKSKDPIVLGELRNDSKRRHGRA